jgi:hypothetical protein
MFTEDTNPSNSLRKIISTFFAHLEDLYEFIFQLSRMNMKNKLYK